jgi:hypothetical protein
MLGRTWPTQNKHEHILQYPNTVVILNLILLTVSVLCLDHLLNLHFLQHETLSANAVGTFGAQVDVHDIKMYIFTPDVSFSAI